jgi:general secretion pathway protein G
MKKLHSPQYMKYNILNTGFTLVELLVVISIIGIISSLGLFTFTSSQQRARDAARKSDIKNMETALRIYFNDKGAYPKSDASFQMQACDPGGTSSCVWGSPWQVGTTVYMQTVPKDPKAPAQNYRYNYIDSDNFTFQACLENSTDVNGIASGAWCASGKMFQLKP